MKIRLAENFRAVFYAPFYATQALGFYEREGLEVELVTSAAPGDAVPALLDGTVDLTWGGPMRVMRAHDADAGSPLVCFGEVVSRDPFYLVGRPDITDFRLADLARLRFATVSEVPTPWMCLQHDLRLAGVDPLKVARVADRTMADNVAALREGRLDVAQLFEPFVTRAVGAGFGKILYAASARGPCVYTSFIATRARAAARLEAFAAVVRATAKMQEWLAGHPGADLAAVAAPYFPDVAPVVLADALGRYGQGQVWAASPAMSRAGFARLGESFLSGGALSRLPIFEACVATAFG
ncbi:MAG TPA: ABC transporter substrate-binding protein [Xanthobacteraceae bacterium]|nr:ABC transporter substrate-binding protein [Xanthobacteraceae bacterium]